MLKHLGRFCLAGIFVVAGAEAFREPGGRVKRVEDAGLPQPELGVRVNGATMVLAGIALALGIAPKWAAGVLIGSLIPTTLVGHAFWKEEAGQARSMQRVQFLKNLGLVGGLLWVLAEERRQTHDAEHAIVPSAEAQVA
jgi:putative oxidoreductase